jgi:hypothetical protein
MIYFTESRTKKVWLIGINMHLTSSFSKCPQVGNRILCTEVVRHNLKPSKKKKLRNFNRQKHLWNISHREFIQLVSNSTAYYTMPWNTGARHLTLRSTEVSFKATRILLYLSSQLRSGPCNPCNCLVISTYDRHVRCNILTRTRVKVCLAGITKFHENRPSGLNVTSGSWFKTTSCRYNCGTRTAFKGRLSAMCSDSEHNSVGMNDGVLITKPVTFACPFSSSNPQ